ncbi:MAG: FAD-dependent oxidoreductase [Fibrobacteria bacterium]
MHIAIVGAGMLGLTLAFRLAKQGHRIRIFEAGDALGGLTCAQDYGEFIWDRYYHCILPQDGKLIGLLRELGLGDKLRWRSTGTGYYAKGKFHSMSNNKDFLAFPLLSLIDKGRLGFTILYATRFADPYKLYGVTAKAWLTKMCGRKTYEVFWLPLLKAKFGVFHDQIAAVFIWATLTRLFGARTAGENQENLGYVSGGYHAILGRLDAELKALGVGIHLETPVKAIETHSAEGGKPAFTRITVAGAGKAEETLDFDQVFFTAPTSLAEKVAGKHLLPYVKRMSEWYPTSHAYLGVICLVLVLKKPLTPYYVLNIGEDLGLTGLIEMTNLIDTAAETKGRSLVYLPRYLDSGDAKFNEPDEAILKEFLEGGLTKLFPGFSAEKDLVSYTVQRARYVQPLPLAREGSGEIRPAPAFERPFQVLNTSMLRCATLNNNEVVGLVDDFLGKAAIPAA